MDMTASIDECIETIEKIDRYLLNTDTKYYTCHYTDIKLLWENAKEYFMCFTLGVPISSPLIMVFPQAL